MENWFEICISHEKLVLEEKKVLEEYANQKSKIMDLDHSLYKI